MTSLNPVLTVGHQIAESVRIHTGASASAGERARGRDAAARQNSRRRAAAFRLPAPVFRRHAPARDDRDRARLQSDAADRRRADHRARRHHPGADPRSDAGAESPHRRRRDPDHAQSRHRGRDLRARDRDVCGPQDRGSRDHRAVRPPGASLHARPDGLDPAPAREEPQAPPRRNPRHRALAARADRGLRLRAALRLCGRALPRRGAGVAADRRPAMSSPATRPSACSHPTGPPHEPGRRSREPEEAFPAAARACSRARSRW